MKLMPVVNINSYRWFILATAILALFLFSVDANAAVSEQSVNNMINEFKNSAATWEPKLLTIATNLFWLLAFIQFAWAMIELAFRGSDISDFVSTIVNQILFICFFYWLLINSSTFAKNIIDSFRNAAAQASGKSLMMPSDFFVEGMKIVNKVLNSISAWSPIDSVGMLVASIVIIVCFALITALIVLTLVEMYIVVSSSVLIMGFGGSRWTKDYAIRTLQYAVSVGAKLFIMQLIAGIGITLVEKWSAQFEANNADIVTMIGCAIILLALTKTIPDLVQGIINGASVGNGGALTAAAAAVGGGIGAVAGAAVGASMATGSAAKLASEQLLDAKTAGNAPTSKMGTAGFMMGSMAKNLGSSLKQDIGSRFSGQNHGHGNMGGRMSGDMSRQAQELKANRQVPQNSPANGNPGTGQNNNPTTSLDKPDNTIS